MPTSMASAKKMYSGRLSRVEPGQGSGTGKVVEVNARTLDDRSMGTINRAQDKLEPVIEQVQSGY